MLSTEGVFCTISLNPGVLSGEGRRAPYLREVRSLAKKYRGVVVGVTFSGLTTYKSPSLVR